MSETQSAAPSAPHSSAWLKLLPEVVVLALCAFLWSATADWSSTVGGPGPAFFPRILIGLLALAMLVRLLHEVREIRGKVTPDLDENAAPEEGAEFDTSLMNNRRVLLAVALSVGYVFATLYLGWVIATFVVTVVFLVLAGKRNLLIVVPLGLIFSLGLAYVFVKVVYISLPTGVGPFDAATVLLFELLGAY